VHYWLSVVVTGGIVFVRLIYISLGFVTHSVCLLLREYLSGSIPAEAAGVAIDVSVADTGDCRSEAVRGRLISCRRAVNSCTPATMSAAEAPEVSPDVVTSTCCILCGLLLRRVKRWIRSGDLAQWESRTRRACLCS